MKKIAKFEAEGESFNACFEQLNSAFNAEFSASGGGQDGKDGATFIPSVSEDGVISWTNDRKLPNPDPVNIKGDRGEQGIQGAKGADGKDGVNGKDGEDGFSPVVAVADIAGGHRVTITDKNGNKTFDVMDGKDGQGGSGGGKAIIDAIELPTENIDEDSFYRLLTPKFVQNQAVINRWNCYCVEFLPSVGEPAIQGSLTDTQSLIVNAYYVVNDNNAFSYITSELSYVFGVPIGWYPISVLMGAVGYVYNGVITDLHNSPLDDSLSLLLEYQLWSYKNQFWTPYKSIGWSGTGSAAEVFNRPDNVASGDGSHAEGYQTSAVGAYSHTEGYRTTASGHESHAEGYNTTASGNCSHAEGSMTTASGIDSHAEGWQTVASEEDSHAEGIFTEATKRGQHVQGRFNILDDSVVDENGYGKYAHIVGNGGGDSSRSNAHTLDWNGLGWFAGGLKVGGTGQDDPNAEEILTKFQVQAMIDEAIAKALG